MPRPRRLPSRLPSRRRRRRHRHKSEAAPARKGRAFLSRQGAIPVGGRALLNFGRTSICSSNSWAKTPSRSPAPTPSRTRRAPTRSKRAPTPWHSRRGPPSRTAVRRIRIRPEPPLAPPRPRRFVLGTRPSASAQETRTTATSSSPRQHRPTFPSLRNAPRRARLGTTRLRSVSAPTSTPPPPKAATRSPPRSAAATPRAARRPPPGPRRPSDPSKWSPRCRPCRKMSARRTISPVPDATPFAAVCRRGRRARINTPRRGPPASVKIARRR
mmetsp:Transcript_674/g.2477  ORF Transcript_674/g.2477 Transcript_674/m.2477 type:complete len:271 (+) Transcript_674:2153-2965(+)